MLIKKIQGNTIWVNLGNMLIQLYQTGQFASLYCAGMA